MKKYRDYFYGIEENNYTIVKDSIVTNGLITGESDLSSEKEVKNIIDNLLLTDYSCKDIKEVKDIFINESKEVLQEYLLQNPLESFVHKNTLAKYSITSVKQTLLTKEIMMCQFALNSNLEYNASWNATGEEYTYDWTIDELMQLAYEITSFVKPYISKQQNIEQQIKNCETVEEILDIEITF